jgi:hypothetical protein
VVDAPLAGARLGARRVVSDCFERPKENHAVAVADEEPDAVKAALVLRRVGLNSNDVLVHIPVHAHAFAAWKARFAKGDAFLDAERSHKNARVTLALGEKARLD